MSLLLNLTTKFAKYEGSIHLIFCTDADICIWIVNIRKNYGSRGLGVL